MCGILRMITTKTTFIWCLGICHPILIIAFSPFAILKVTNSLSYNIKRVGFFWGVLLLDYITAFYVCKCSVIDPSLTTA